MRRSLSESLEALGLEKVEILHLHDPEYAADITQITAPGGALDELFKIKDEGLADYVGLAAGKVDVMLPLIESFEFDFMVTHNRFSIINSNAEPLINRAVARGTVVLNAAPYMGGVLAKGPDAFPRMTYMPAGPRKAGPGPQTGEPVPSVFNPAGRGRAAVFDPRSPGWINDLWRLAARAHRRDGRMGHVANSGRVLGGGPD